MKKTSRNQWMAAVAAATLIMGMAGLEEAGAALVKVGDVVARENFTGYPDNGPGAPGTQLNGYNPANDGTNQIGWNDPWSGDNDFIADSQTLYGSGSWVDFGSGPSGQPTAWIANASGSVGRAMLAGITAPATSFESVEFWMTVYMRNAGYGGVPGRTSITDAFGDLLFGVERPDNNGWRILARNGSGAMVYSPQIAGDPNSFGEYVIRGLWTTAGVELYLWARPDGADTLATFDASLTSSADGLALSADPAYMVLYSPGTGDGRTFMWDDFELTSLTTIPEPASVALLGLAGLVLLRRRRA